MIFFTVIGLLFASAGCIMVGLIGFAGFAYNPKASSSQAIGGVVMMLAAVAAIYWLWRSFSPFIVVVAP